jgi:hypothetical protein
VVLGFEFTWSPKVTLSKVTPKSYSCKDLQDLRGVPSSTLKSLSIEGLLPSWWTQLLRGAWSHEGIDFGNGLTHWWVHAEWAISRWGRVEESTSLGFLWRLYPVLAPSCLSLSLLPGCHEMWRLHCHRPTGTILPHLRPKAVDPPDIGLKPLKPNQNKSFLL